MRWLLLVAYDIARSLVSDVTDRFLDRPPPHRERGQRATRTIPTLDLIDLDDGPGLTLDGHPHELAEPLPGFGDVDLVGDHTDSATAASTATSTAIASSSSTPDDLIDLAEPSSPADKPADVGSAVIDLADVAGKADKEAAVPCLPGMDPAEAEPADRTG